MLPYEYVTDQFILYSSLWGLIGLNIPFRDPAPVFIAFSKKSYVERMLLEPFSNSSQEVLISPVKDINGEYVRNSQGDIVTFVNGNFWVKNLLEPYFFLNLGLYLKAKNYHPLLIIGEIFAMSLLYEFTIRPFWMNANFEQLLKNPSVALILTFILDEFSTYLLTSNLKPLHIFAYIINPFKLLPNSRIYPLIFLKPYQNNIQIEISLALF